MSWIGSLFPPGLSLNPLRSMHILHFLYSFGGLASIVHSYFLSHPLCPSPFITSPRRPSRQGQVRSQLFRPVVISSLLYPAVQIFYERLFPMRSQPLTHFFCTTEYPVLHTAGGHRMAHRKWKETITKQQPSLLPGPAGPGCSLVSFHFLCPQAVILR